MFWEVEKYVQYPTLEGCMRMQNVSISTNELRRAGGPRPYLDSKCLYGIRDYSRPVYICQGRGEVPSPASCWRVLG